MKKQTILSEITSIKVLSTEKTHQVKGGARDTRASTTSTASGI
jgi:hypothetical protein